MKRLSILFVLLGAALVSLLWTSCSKKPPSLNLAFVTNNSDPFWEIARAGCEEARLELGDVTVAFRMPASGTMSEQRQILDSLTIGGVDGIAVSPIDPNNQTALLNRMASQTLLVCHDSDAPASNRVCYIGTDNVAAGMQAGRLVLEALPEGGEIMVFVGTLEAQNAVDRYDGIRKVLEGSNVGILGVLTDDIDPVRAQNNAVYTLVHYPEVDCLVGLWSYNGPAMVHAVESLGRGGQVKIICFDEAEEVLAGVAEGVIYATVVQQPFEFGKQSIMRMHAYLRGDRSSLEGGHIYVPTLSIKQDNVEDFQSRLDAILGK